MTVLQRPHSPSRDDDIAYPIHYFDNVPFVRDLVMLWTMRFNDVLDPEVLRRSLVKVLDTGDWRKLAGRLRKVEDGQYELRVPRQFTEDRPAVTFTQEEFDMPIDQHPLGKLMPKATNQPSMQTKTQLLEPLQGLPDARRRIATYLSEDLPQLSLHVVTFADATLVTVTWLHIVMDAMGLRELVAAWALAMHGKASEIPRLMGSRQDVAKEISDPSNETEEYIGGREAPSTLTSFRFQLRLLWDMFWGYSQTESRIIHIPKATLDQMRQEAQDQVKDQGERISRGDVIMSWVVRTVAAAGSSNPRPITMQSPVDLRSRVQGLCEPGAAYVQNLYMLKQRKLSAEEAVQATAGEIALKFRRTLKEQATSAQLLAHLTSMQRNGRGGGNKTDMLVCEPNSRFVSVTNWAKGNWCALVDFGPAVVTGGEDAAARSNSPGTMLYSWPHEYGPYAGHQTLLYVLGEDHNGDYWITGKLPPSVWPKAEESLSVFMAAT